MIIFLTSIVNQLVCSQETIDSYAIMFNSGVGSLPYPFQFTVTRNQENITIDYKKKTKTYYRRIKRNKEIKEFINAPTQAQSEDQKNRIIELHDKYSKYKHASVSIDSNRFPSYFYLADSIFQSDLQTTGKDLIKKGMVLLDGSVTEIKVIRSDSTSNSLWIHSALVKKSPLISRFIYETLQMYERINNRPFIESGFNLK